MAKGVVYSATVTNLSTGEKETYTGLTEVTMRDKISKHKSNCRHKEQPGTRLSSVHPSVEVERQGGTLLGHLADPVQSKQLQPHHRDVPPLSEREVPDHVCLGHGFPKQEDGDLLELQA